MATKEYKKGSRSYIMSKVGQKGTKPEMSVRTFLHSHGFRYRLNDKKLPGSPDIVLPKYKTVIFVHGCFWHRHEKCSKATTPKNNYTFWNDKFRKNIARDAKKEEEIKALDWQVITLWECELGKKKIENTLDALLNKLRETLVARII